MKCVLHLSCVVHGPIYGPFMGCTVNGFLSLSLRGAQVSWEEFTVPSIREFELFSLKAICCRNFKAIITDFCSNNLSEIYLVHLLYQ